MARDLSPQEIQGIGIELGKMGLANGCVRTDHGQFAIVAKTGAGTVWAFPPASIQGICVVWGAEQGESEAKLVFAEAVSKALAAIYYAT